MNDGMISFIHRFSNLASHRYRAGIPAALIGASMNDLSADVLIFSKPCPRDWLKAKEAVDAGRTVVVDYCDHHFDRWYYEGFVKFAHHITCSTDEMAKIVRGITKTHVTVIADPYEYPLEAPHCAGNNLLWFGGRINYKTLERVRPQLEGYPLRVVCDLPETIQWSHKTMLDEFKHADIVVIPETPSYKGCNRAMESVRQGCYVVAEPHPSLKDIPGIWIGDLRGGVEWASSHLDEANAETAEAAQYVSVHFSPEFIGDQWASLCETLLKRRFKNEPISAKSINACNSVHRDLQLLA